jgi:hypothetical protein
MSHEPYRGFGPTTTGKPKTASITSIDDGIRYTYFGDRQNVSCWLSRVEGHYRENYDVVFCVPEESKVLDLFAESQSWPINGSINYGFSRAVVLDFVV